MTTCHSSSYFTMSNMSNGRSLEEINLDLDLLCLDIENLNDRDKIVAVHHLEESLRVLKLGSSLPFDKPVGGNRQSEAVKPEGVVRKFQNVYNGLVPTCDKCGLTFPSLGSLDSHGSQCQHVARQEVKMENFSQKRSESPSKRKKQNDATKERTAEEKTYQCSDCEKKFSKKDSLTWHRVSHTTKYQCPNCCHTFSEQRKLNRHLTNKENCKKYLSHKTNKLKLNAELTLNESEST